MRLHSLLKRRLSALPRPHRRPSAALVISVTALFMSMGGVGYAAVSLPANSVGQSQLRNDSVSYKKIVPNAVGAVRLANGGVTNSKLANGSVSYKKIQPAAVGTVRANLNQLQARVNGTCAAGSAIGAIDKTGKATCNGAAPAEFGTASVAKPVTGAPALVQTLTLPAGASYLAFANPTVSVTGTGADQRVTVTCTLTVGAATNVETRTATVDTRTVKAPVTTSIPLQVAGPAGTASVACSAAANTGALPATTATAAINALQTAANNS